MPLGSSDLSMPEMDGITSLREVMPVA